MRRDNQSGKNVYVRKVELNGREISRTFITHSEIMNADALPFIWAKDRRFRNESLII
ncbi:MAG: hypothetical protein ACR2F2_11850 [Pyrinomonadaceae bacterium]